MKTTKMSAILVLALGLTMCWAGVSEAGPMGTAFTYQGRLIDNNSVADDFYDFQFKLFDDSNDPCSGNQLGSDVNKPDVDVIDGYFTVEMDFGGGIFDGNAVWLETGVRPGEMNDPNVYTALSPRVGLTPTPYALHTRWFLVDEALDNIFLGEEAGASNTTGSDNSAMGYYALFSNTTGNENSAMGNYALQFNTTGYRNSAMGNYALRNNTTGGYNSAVGMYALRDNTAGTWNSAMGYQALFYNTTGHYNTAMGYRANLYNQEGSRNTIIGYDAGRGTTYHNKSGNVFLGYKAGYYETGDNKLYIANDAADSNVLIYGDFSTNRIGINTSSPQGALDVVSTSGAFIVPRMTTAQRNALTAVNGMIIYNQSTNQFNFLENGAWVAK